MKKIITLSMLFIASALIAQEDMPEAPSFSLSGSVDAYYRANISAPNDENAIWPGSSFANLLRAGWFYSKAQSKMKRKLLACFLGIGAATVTASSSYGQGQIWFDNYNNPNINGVGGYSSPIYLVGDQLLPASFTVSLYYALGTVTDPWLVNNLAATSPIKPQTPGYVVASVATIPDYVSGPITFRLMAQGNVGGLQYIGGSAPLTLPSISKGTMLPGYLVNLQSFAIVPEPAAMTLIGLSGMGVFAIRRRK